MYKSTNDVISDIYIIMDYKDECFLKSIWIIADISNY